MRPRAVLPQDSLPAEVAGMKISIPLASLAHRRLFSSFPLAPCARTSFDLDALGVSGIRSCSSSSSSSFSPVSLVAFPGIPILNDTPRNFTRKTPSEIYARVQTRPRCCRATFSDRYRWHKRGVTRDYRRYQPLPAATTLRRIRRQRQMRKYSAVTGD